MMKYCTTIMRWTYDVDEPKQSVGGWLSDGGIWLPDGFGDEE